MFGFASPWTDNRTAFLRERWNGGASASIIAAELGVTRNAVIGKVHRLELDQHRPCNSRPGASRRRPDPSYVPRTDRPTRTSINRARQEIGQEFLPIPRGATRALERKLLRDNFKPPRESKSIQRKPGGVSLFQLTAHTCRWPNGDPGAKGFHFCGAAPVAGVPYCHEHAALAYHGTR